MTGELVTAMIRTTVMSLVMTLVIVMSMITTLMMMMEMMVTITGDSKQCVDDYGDD